MFWKEVSVTSYYYNHCGNVWGVPRREPYKASRVHSCYNNNEIEFNYYQIKNETTKALYL